jgi:hypothetical protein
VRRLATNARAASRHERDSRPTRTHRIQVNMYAHWFWKFFKSSWNWFDLLVRICRSPTLDGVLMRAAAGGVLLPVGR